MREVLQYLTSALAAGREVLACQVVETRGSTPQKAGALMVVEPDGRQVGTLGGGCVEAEVKQRAIHRLGSDGSELHAFVLDHDHAWADGLVCGGKMTIVVSALRGQGAAEYFQEMRAQLESGKGFTEAVAIDVARCGAHAVGSRFLFDSEGRFLTGWPERAAPACVIEQVAPISDRPKAASRVGVAVLPTLPRIRLLIIGAGHVGQAVAELAARADFDVWVIDDRRQYANNERFPSVSRIIVGAFDATLPALEVTPHTFALIVTRGHGHDQEALDHLARTPAAYVGLIGSRRKIRLIFDSLLEQGLAPEALDRVTAPVGLQIGSQSVFEIAVSIVAELIARRNLASSPTAGRRGAAAEAAAP
jgi:xanthine dehydrogenase accessory factor